MEAQRRVCLSALYIGTSKLDEFMVRQLDKKLERNHDLHVRIVIDNMRGTRVEKDGKSSFGLLSGLRMKVGESVRSSTSCWKTWR